MPRRSKSTRVVSVESLRASNQVLDAFHRFREMHHARRESQENAASVPPMELPSGFKAWMRLRFAP
jgi:hypothetical protein